MDTIIKIFTALGVDSSIFTQFGIIVVLYFVIKFTLFTKLQEVLDLREDRTTKLEGSANDKLVEAENMEAKFHNEINRVQTEAYIKFSTEKNEILKEKQKKVKVLEKELEEIATVKRKEIESEMKQKKEQVMKSASELSNNLVEKLVN
jgi:F-type H+-transporting ATPase subunit b